MPTPRENTSVVKAPVLFRLPHLQRAAAAAVASTRNNSGDPASHSTSSQAAASPVIENDGDCHASFVNRPSAAVEQTRSTASGVPEPLVAAAADSFMSRWGMEIKRSVILLAAMALLWGAWAMGQKSATVPNESNLAAIGEIQLSGDAEPVAEIEVASGPAVNVSKAPEVPQVSQIVEPKLGSSASFAGAFDPVTEPEPSFYGGEASVGNAAPTVTKSDSIADFSQLSLDAIEPPANGEFYSDYPLGESGQSSVQKPPVTNDAADSNQLALNQPIPSAATAAAPLPPATNFVPSATPEMPGFDPTSIENIGAPAPVNRPALSSTPNGIIDWSRYLPGAGGNGTIRAVSAAQAMGETRDNAGSVESQAIFLDKNDPQSPNVGVAPFYR